VSTILNSVYRYAMENNSKWPTTIPTGTPKVICRTKAKSCNNGVNLDILSGVYLVTVPSDPLTPSSGTGTWYTIVQDANQRITVSAPHAEQDANISVTR
jgi:hypothetical protein